MRKYLKRATVGIACVAAGLVVGLLAGNISIAYGVCYDSTTCGSYAYNLGCNTICGDVEAGNSSCKSHTEFNPHLKGIPNGTQYANWWHNDISEWCTFK